MYAVSSCSSIVDARHFSNGTEVHGLRPRSAALGRSSRELREELRAEERAKVAAELRQTFTARVTEVHRRAPGRGERARWKA